MIAVEAGFQRAFPDENTDDGNFAVAENQCFPTKKGVDFRRKYLTDFLFSPKKPQNTPFLKIRK